MDEKQNNSFFGMANAILSVIGTIAASSLGAPSGTSVALSAIVAGLSSLAKNDGLKKDQEEILSAFADKAESQNSLTALDIAALSKALKDKTALPDELKSIRNKITQEEAKAILTSTELALVDNQFEYNGKHLSKEKLKQASRVVALFGDITLDQVLRFSQVLFKYPYLALSDETGMRVLEECRSIPDDYIAHLSVKDSFFRARKKECEEIPFSEDEMWQAPFKTPGQGRFNTQGVARFYLTDSAEAAQDEIIKHARKKGKGEGEEQIYIQTARFEVHEDIALLDLKKVNTVFAKNCKKSVSKPSEFNVEYLYGGFLAQCIEYCGQLDGILYGDEKENLIVLFKNTKMRFAECMHTAAPLK